jgi:hypothetical protein
MMYRHLPALFVLAVFVCGCPGRLDEAEIASFGDGSYCAPGITAEGIFEAHCGGSICHGDGQSPASDLDLISPGIEGRVALAPSDECEGGERLVVPGAPDESVLYWKITGPPSGCGDPMPVLGRLAPSEISCIRAWIHDMAASGSVGADGGMP